MKSSTIKLIVLLSCFAFACSNSNEKFENNNETRDTIKDNTKVPDKPESDWTAVEEYDNSGVIPDFFFDYEGNKYAVVEIGKQVWIAENLKTKTFNNGDEIFHAKTNEDWLKACENQIPAWCYLESSSVNAEQYGVLYNYYVISDSRGISPESWVVPSKQDWKSLIDFTEETYDYCIALKFSDGEYWMGEGSNETGMKLLPGGSRGLDGSFYEDKYSSVWWAKDEQGKKAGIVEFVSSVTIVRQDYCHKCCGYYIRLIKE